MSANPSPSDNPAVFLAAVGSSPEIEHLKAVIDVQREQIEELRRVHVEREESHRHYRAWLRENLGTDSLYQLPAALEDFRNDALIKRLPPPKKPTVTLKFWACGCEFTTTNAHAKRCRRCQANKTKANAQIHGRGASASLPVEVKPAEPSPPRIATEVPGIARKTPETLASYTKTCGKCRMPYEVTSKHGRGTWCPSCRLESELATAPQSEQDDSALNVRRRIACAGCKFGVEEPRADTGYMCRAGRFRECQPYTKAACYVPKGAVTP